MIVATDEELLTKEQQDIALLFKDALLISKKIKWTVSGYQRLENGLDSCRA